MSAVLIQFGTENDAFARGRRRAIAATLRRIAERIEEGRDDGKVMDGNGNSIGTFDTNHESKE